MTLREFFNRLISKVSEFLNDLLDTNISELFQAVIFIVLLIVWAILIFSVFRPIHERIENWIKEFWERNLDPENLWQNLLMAIPYLFSSLLLLIPVWFIGGVIFLLPPFIYILIDAGLL